jgi:hypothetical protein
MVQVWAEIQKPDYYKYLQIFDCFNFEFHTVSVKDFAPEEFKADMAALKDRFKNPNNPEFLLKEAITDMPADGLPLYCMEIWEQIKSEKDLNIPSQKELIATLRCNEIRHVAFDKFLL